jgi:hypothetical protein
MRQIIIIGPLLFLLLFVLYLFTPDFSSRLEPELFIDEEVLLMVTQKDLATRIDEFSSSPLGRTLAEIDFLSLSKELDYESFDGEKIDSLRTTISRTLNDPLVKLLFGKEVTLALYPFRPDNSRSFDQQIYENVLLIGRPKHHAKLIDMLTKLVPQQDRITEAPYGGHVIKRFPLNQNMVISAARVKDLFVFSANERLLRRGLDHYDDGTDSLAQQAAFVKTKIEFKGASLFSYVNIERIHQSTAGALNSFIPEDEENRLTRELDKYKGYRGGFFGAWKEKDKIFEKAIVGFDRDVLSDEAARAMMSEPGTPDTLSRVADDTLLYYWTSRLELDPLLELISLVGGQGQAVSVEELFQQVGSITGMEPGEIAGILENPMTLAIKTIPEQQFVPIPSFMVAIQVQDPEKVKRAVTNLVEHFTIPIRHLKIKGVEAITWGGVIGVSSLQPTLAYAGNYLVLASNQEQIEEFIDLPSDKTRLDQTSRFKRVENGLAGKNNSIVFLDFVETTAMFKEMVSWGGTMIAIKDRDVARRSKLLIDRVINPLLDGLAMYSVIGMRKTISGNSIIFETTTTVDYGKK